MLDKQTTHLLQNLNTTCNDGNYKVLEKAELLNLMSKYGIDEESLESMLQHLKERSYLNIKYADENVYCLAVLPKGRLFDEKSKELKMQKKKDNKLIVTTMTLSCVASFVGAFVAMIIYNLIFWGTYVK